MRALPATLALLAALGSALVLQSALFFVAGRGADALPSGALANALLLGGPLALAASLRRRAPGWAIAIVACVGLALASLVVAEAARPPPLPCDDTASCVGPAEGPIVMAAQALANVFGLAALGLAAVGSLRKRALPGRARWLPALAIGLSAALAALYPLAVARGVGDRLTALQAAISLVLWVGVAALLGRGASPRDGTPPEIGVEPPA